MGTPLERGRPPAREGPTERSSTGAPRRLSRGATSCCRSRSPALSEAAGLTVAVKRLAKLAVLGEATEDLFFTFSAADREGNFSAPTTGGCTDERSEQSEARAAVPRRRVHRRCTATRARAGDRLARGDDR